MAGEAPMLRKRSIGAARCEQETVRGDRCMRPATFERTERNGTVERYCTQHANHYAIHRQPSRVRDLRAQEASQ